MVLVSHAIYLRMPKLVFEISDDEYSNLLKVEIELKGFLERILNDRTSEIIDGLLEYHKEAGGSPTIPGFQITECSYDKDNHTGKVKFKYQVFFTFGCADLHPSEVATETSKFEINPVNNKLILFLTDHITRDTLDEF